MYYEKKIEKFPSEIIFNSAQSKFTSLAKEAFFEKNTIAKIIRKISGVSRPHCDDEFNLRIGLNISLIKTLGEINGLSRSSVSNYIDSLFEWSPSLRDEVINSAVLTMAMMSTGMTYNKVKKLLDSIYEKFDMCQKNSNQSFFMTAVAEGYIKVTLVYK